MIYGAAGVAYVSGAAVATGLSSNPFSQTPFRPNSSPQPWMYVADSAPDGNVTVSGGFTCAGMIKIQSDGTTRKDGIKEPQISPVVSTSGTTTVGTDALPATTIPWTNVGGVNSAYNYGHTSGTDGTSPVLITLPAGSQTLTLVVTGTATVNGATHAPGDAGPASSTYPANFTGPGPTIVVGAFTDGAGNVLTGTSPVPLLANVGANSVLQVPAGANEFQIGVDSSANTFNSNSGSFSVNWTLVVSAIATTVSTLGNVTAYYWGDSPHSGPVATYIWKNPNDGGTGTPRTIETAAGSVTNNSWIFDSTPEDGTVPVQWSTLDSSGTVTGSIPLFTPALESEGYQDFNACVVGTLFIPAAGTYTFTFKYKDQILVGFGGGVTVGTPSGAFGTSTHNGQTETVVNALPLAFIGAINGEGGSQTGSIPVTFTGSGSYQVEIDWDYWEHTGRSLTMTCNSAVIPPLPAGVRTGVSYAYKWRDSRTGAQSNPSPTSNPQITPVLDNTVTPVYSPDPQVNTVDFYRQDSGLANYTYVGSGPNTNPPTSIVDSLSDLDAANNQVMATDDYEPYPSIDLPKNGVVSVTGGEITWVSGDQFNIRWLGGSVILIGSPTQIAYSLYSRPTSVTTMIIPGVPDGTNLVYSIPEPILAAQPLPSQWGPTDNTSYMFACYDPLRPGTLYFTKGNNPDSAPDTNQIEVTSPSEPLMNGDIVRGISMVFSTERCWLCYPTFTTALATVSGVSGSPFNLILADSEYGLYIRTAIGSAGGQRIGFRAKDSVRITEGGASISITDSIYNLFPHGGEQPSTVSVGGQTVYPPDDTKPNAQKIRWSEGYWFYDYQDVNGTPRTLVYEEVSKGWSVDLGSPQFTAHANVDGQAEGTYIGCSDGTVRQFVSTGTENVLSVVATGSQNGGEARAYKQIGDVYFKGTINAANPVGVALWLDRYTSNLTGFTPTSLTGTGALSDYIVNFTSTAYITAQDIASVLTWTTGAGNILEIYQPDWIPLPENTENRATDWDAMGSQGNKLVRGFILELDTLGNSKAIALERAEDHVIFAPNESPMTISGETIKAFTFTPPFVTHSVRMITGDGVPWRIWTTQWVTDPWVEYATFDSAWSDLGIQGAKYIRGLVLPMDTQGQPAIINIVTSDGATVQFTANTPGAVKTPVAFAFVPPIVAHDVQINMLTSTAGAWVPEARWDMDAYPEIIPEYTPIMEIGGPDNKFMQGIKLIADTANQPVNFQILYDGGQAGPTFTGAFNGKQTLIFSWAPFLAHDVQLVPQADARIWWGGIGDGVSEWVYEPFAEAATTWATEITAMGGTGWQHLRYINIEYNSTTPITLEFTVDTGNGSIAPSTLIIPSSGGTQTKLKLTVTYNKWKLLGISATSSQAFYLMKEGMEFYIRSWGSSGAYRVEHPFGGPTNTGASV